MSICVTTKLNLVFLIKAHSRATNVLHVLIQSSFGFDTTPLGQHYRAEWGGMESFDSGGNRWGRPKLIF